MNKNTKTLSLAILASLLPIVVNAAIIVVDQKTCTLADAIQAANGDTRVGGCARGRGADTIEVKARVKIRTSFDGTNSLPPIQGKLIINGHNNQILNAYGAGTRLFYVPARSNLTLNDVWLRFGVGDSGGGGAIFNSAGGKVAINRSTLSENLSNDLGGAIANGGDLEITNSTIANNDSYYNFGGAISSYNDGQPQHVTIVNSTIDGNYAVGCAAFDISGPVKVQLTHVTVTDNIGGKAQIGGYCGYNGANLSMKNTVMAGSVDYPRTIPGVEERHIDCVSDTPVSDLRGNLIENDPFNCLSDSDFPDGTDPKLSDMAMYGGPTPTRLPTMRSPLLNAAQCGMKEDQRGSKRARNECDMGAVGIFKPLDTLFLKFDGYIAKGKLAGIGKTDAKKKKRVTDYRNLLVSARNGRIQKNQAMMCNSLKDAHRRLDRNGTIQPYEWINGKATKALTSRIEKAQKENKCIK